MVGYVHSMQTLGTVDGPGIRLVVFLQGCNLRCCCCHNPDTWSMPHLYADTRSNPHSCSVTGSNEHTKITSMSNSITEYSVAEVLQYYQKYEMYYGENGGITISGGEPLLQAEFIYELFTLCKTHNIHTCLDTSGSIFNPKVEKLLSVTDLVLLDIKYTNEEDYQRYVGCSYDVPLHFLDYLNEHKIPTWIRQVIITGINDNELNINLLQKIISSHNCVKRYQLLPFHKICSEKYDRLGIPFPFAHIEETTSECVTALEGRLHL